ncbi:uncharacterized protein [Triticum aestivum]|uniref:uncharacterized protein isoform X2 n=1 Tax=Triticum aestivum TaxID=4565 RepID=UPI001D019FCF|nr:uncharacterized protein LOC123157041 isoform X2 [Triticum aestivum]
MGSPPLPLAHEVTAAAAHAGRFRRAPALRSTASSSACSAPPSPPARFSSPGLYRPLATTPPWLGFRAVLRRRVSGGPRCRWSTPWEFPIHHGRCRQGLLQGDVKDAIDLQLLKGDLASYLETKSRLQSYKVIRFAPETARSLKEKRFSYAPESGVRYDGVYRLRTVGGRLVFSAVGRSAYRVPPRRLLPPPTWDLTACSPPGTPTTLEAEQMPLARGHGSRVQDGDGAKEDSRTSTDCIVAAVSMEWRGSNHSEMAHQWHHTTRNTTDLITNQSLVACRSTISSLW